MTSFSRDDHPAVRLAPSADVARGAVKRQLQLEFAPDAHGRTYISRQFVAYPFHVCRALYNDPVSPELAALYIQSCSGGLYESDSLDIALDAKSGAAAHVTTQASTVVHTMPAGSATQHARIRAEAQSYFEYLPDPQILFPQSRLSSTIDVGLSQGAVVLVSDSFLMHDPEGAGRAFSSYLSEIKIEDDAGRRLSVDRMHLDGAVLQAHRPGIMGAFAAQGTLIAAGIGSFPKAAAQDLARLVPGDRTAAIGVSELPRSCGLVVRILASDGATLRKEMHGAWSALRLLIKGRRPPLERK